MTGNKLKVTLWLSMKGQNLLEFFLENKKIYIKAIAMMRMKSRPSEHILEKIKSINSLGLKEDLEREIISFLSKYHFVVFIHIYFDK